MAVTTKTNISSFKKKVLYLFIVVEAVIVTIGGLYLWQPEAFEKLTRRSYECSKFKVQKLFEKKKNDGVSGVVGNLKAPYDPCSNLLNL